MQEANLLVVFPKRHHNCTFWILGAEAKDQDFHKTESTSYLVRTETTQIQLGASESDRWQAKSGRWMEDG